MGRLGWEFPEAGLGAPPGLLGRARYYRPPGRPAGLRAAGGPTVPQVQLAEACWRCWGARPACCLFKGVEAPTPWELPQRLWPEQCSRQDKVEEEEAQPGPGVQSPQHGEDHLSVCSSGIWCALPHLTKGGHSIPRTPSGPALWARQILDLACSRVSASGVVQQPRPGPGMRALCGVLV